MMTLKFNVDEIFEKEIENLYKAFEINDLFVKITRESNRTITYVIKNTDDKVIIDFLSTITDCNMKPILLALL